MQSTIVIIIIIFFIVLINTILIPKHSVTIF